MKIFILFCFIGFGVITIWAAFLAIAKAREAKKLKKIIKEKYHEPAN